MLCSLHYTFILHSHIYPWIYLTVFWYFCYILELQTMSQAGEESSSSSDTELEIEEEQPVCALAPTVYSRDEGSTDVTASPAFQCLNEVQCTPALSITVNIVSKSINMKCVFCC